MTDGFNGRGLAVLGGGLAAAAVLIGAALLGGRIGGASTAQPGPEPSVAYSGCYLTGASPSPSPAVDCVRHDLDPTPSPEYGTTATPTVPPLDYNRAQIARLGAAYERRLRAVAARGTTFLDTFVNGKGGGAFDFAVRSGGPAGNGGRFAEGFTAATDLRDRAGTGNVLLTIGKPIAAKAPDGRPWPPGYGVGQFRDCPDPDGCTVRTGPHGETLVVMPEFQDDERGKIARVDVTKIDGTGVSVEVRSWGLGQSDAETGARRRPGLPLTVEETIELACDPAFAMTA